MAGNRLFIGGQDFTQWAAGLDELTESFSLKEDGLIELGQTSQVILSGEGYEYWNDIFFNDSCNSINNEYDVRIKIGDCKLSLDFVLKSQGVSIDPVNCTIKLNLNTKNEYDQATEVLKQTYFWDFEHGFVNWALGKNRIHKVLTVNHLDYISKVIVIFWFIVLAPLRLLVLAIAAVINAIIDAVNTLPGVDIDNIDVNQTVGEIGDDVLGAGEYTTVCYIKDILEFWANKSGLTFRSSILYDPAYIDTAIFAKQFSKGFDITDIDKYHFDEENAPNINPVELLNILKPVFNADYRIIGNELIFERIDFFDNLKQVTFNLEQEVKAGRITNEFEYTFDNQKNPARFLGEFAYDSIDTQGNRATEFYRKNAEYNPGLIYKNRKGDIRPQIEVSPVRCTEDKFKDGLLSFYWDAFGQINYLHSIVLTQTFASNFKLLCIDQTNTLGYRSGKFHFVCKTQIEPPQNNNQGDIPDYSGKYEYNYPFWFTNLYDKFHFINDPALNLQRFVEIQTITWKPEDFCSAVNFLRSNKLNIKISSKYGDGVIMGGFSINYQTCSIDFQDIRFKCNS